MTSKSPISTLVSVYRSLPRRDDNQLCEFFRPYDVLTVDEESQAAECDRFPLMSCIAYSRRPYPERCPWIVVIRDPLPLGPPVLSNCPFPVKEVNKYSFFERMSPRASTLLLGRNILPTIQLNVHYRTANIISDLSDEITQRQVYTDVDRHRLWRRQPLPG